MSEIKELKIIDDERKSIFSNGDSYIIPLYQRAFAWERDEICQLIDDIYGIDASEYYLGSLIVDVREDGTYEVIDGQQRLTALYLLLNYLEYSWDKDRLRYECREKSNYTLNYLLDKTGDNVSVDTDDDDKIEKSLLQGKKYIIERFRDKGNVINLDTFKEQLKKVKLFRIEVPKHTDLNRYFEIMNVRGEQLEQHDILKANLMGKLEKDENKQKIFAIVWNACSDMTGYVQMHFGKDYREALFGEKWDSSPNLLKLDELAQPKQDEGKDKVKSNDKQSAIEIINSEGIKPTADGEDEEGKFVRFESIISFPYFLLHTLKVFVSTQLNITSSFMSRLLDETKLSKTFDDVMKESKVGEQEFSWAFIKYLLKCRFLFDKYVIKREYYLNDDKVGKWSLKELCVSKKYSKKSPYYKNTTFNEQSFDDNLMLQACMRVSYTSGKVMHWITQYLKCLWSDESKLSDAINTIEDIAKEEVKKFVQEKDYRLGLDTPHIIFHYLDYLLWKERNNNEKYKKLDFGNFVFEFRNSVEHWYPQHPSGDSCAPWDDREDDSENGRLLRDSFGNLCIVSSNINSRFSNASPESKNGYAAAKNGSLKLRLMSDLTTDADSWRNGGYKAHQDAMIDLLKKAYKEKACNIE